MSINSTTSNSFRSPTARPLPPELLDGVTEAMMSSSGAAARSDVISLLVHEMYHSVAWLRDSAEDDDELASLLRVVEAAEAHRVRQTGQGGSRLTSKREAS